MAFSLDSMNMMMGQDIASHNMPCCSVESPVNSMNHDVPILSVSIEKLLKMLTAVLIGFFTYLILRKYLYLSNAVYLYIKQIRSLYGGWQLLNPLVNLFRIGILHPKTW